ncbi:MAG: Gfo/Idh/MocA family oxidoreductase [Bacteroidota bacterium]
MKGKSVTRREFVKVAGAAGAVATILPRHVLGGPGFTAPSDKLNIAAIGAGGMGAENMRQVTSENIVAICDVNFDHVHNGLHDGEGKIRDGREALAAAYQKAARYSDFRVMLEKQKDIDAVVIATPDHTHAVAASMAMRMGKHVYVQKPLTWSVHEARVLQKLAADNPALVTQMGNQGHSTDQSRRVNELIQAGAIGEIREVHVWTNRPVWPQGVPRPKRPKLGKDTGWGMDDVQIRTAVGFTGRRKPKKPKSLNWDLFLGPAPKVDYHPIYQPFTWRGWLDYGTGALGDMGAHLIDHPFWALDLNAPKSVEATSTPWGADNISPWGGAPRDIASFPFAMTAHYEFEARHDLPPVNLHWYDGGLMPTRSAFMPDDEPLPRAGGVIYEGSKGAMMHIGHGLEFKMYPDHLNEEHADLPETYERVTTSHEMNWANACKGIGEAVSPFSYAAPLTETMLLGIVALRTGQGVKIHWDADKGEVTNNEDANQYLHREYRAGYEL